MSLWWVHTSTWVARLLSASFPILALHVIKHVECCDSKSCKKWAWSSGSEYYTALLGHYVSIVFTRDSVAKMSWKVLRKSVAFYLWTGHVVKSRLWKNKNASAMTLPHIHCKLRVCLPCWMPKLVHTGKLIQDGENHVTCVVPPCLEHLFASISWLSILTMMHGKYRKLDWQKFFFSPHTKHVALQIKGILYLAAFPIFKRSNAYVHKQSPSPPLVVCIIFNSIFLVELKLKFLIFLMAQSSNIMLGRLMTICIFEYFKNWSFLNFSQYLLSW